MTRTSQVTLERQSSDTAEPQTAPELQDVESRARSSEDKPTIEEIAEEAYAIYMANGGRDGNHMEDWLEAERRVHAKRSQRL
jgi:hypothetical protein